MFRQVLSEIDISTFVLYVSYVFNNDINPFVSNF